MPRKAPKTKKARALPLRIREWRDKRGWTQAELAALLDTSDASINRLEKGKQNWTPDFLLDASLIFGCTIYDLLPEDPNSIFAPLLRLDEENRQVALAMIDGLERAKRRA